MNEQQRLELLVEKLHKHLIKLEYCDHTHVTMRIEKERKFIKECYLIASDELYGSKYDLVPVVPEGMSLTFTVNGEQISAGANVLNYQDVLTITATANTGYNITSIKVNGVEYVEDGVVKPMIFTINENIGIVCEDEAQALDISTSGDNVTYTLKKNGSPISAGEGVINYGDTISVSASAVSGYTLTSLKINNVEKVSEEQPIEFVATSNIVIVAEAEEESAGGTPFDEGDDISKVYFDTSKTEQEMNAIIKSIAQGHQYVAFIDGNATASVNFMYVENGSDIGVEGEVCIILAGGSAVYANQAVSAVRAETVGWQNLEEDNSFVFPDSPTIALIDYYVDGSEESYSAGKANLWNGVWISSTPFA